MDCKCCDLKLLNNLNKLIYFKMNKFIIYFKNKVIELNKYIIYGFGINYVEFKWLKSVEKGKSVGGDDMRIIKDYL